MSRSILKFGIFFLGLLCGAVSVSAADSQLYRVIGQSMQPTLAAGSKVNVLQHDFSVIKPEPGQLVAIYLQTQPVPMVKRVVAVAGEFVVIQPSHLVVADRRYPIAAGKAEMLRLQLARNAGKVPFDQLIVLGDNPAASLDSQQLGLISVSQLVGFVKSLAKHH